MTAMPVNATRVKATGMIKSWTYCLRKLGHVNEKVYGRQQLSTYALAFFAYRCRRYICIRNISSIKRFPGTLTVKSGMLTVSEA